MNTRIVAAIVAAAAAAPAMGGGITFFTNQDQFTIFNQLEEKFLKGIEDFEESEVGQGQKMPFPNSLQNGVPRPTFPNGISATNLIIQTNITPGPYPAALNPSPDDRALWVNGAGFIGSNSIKVGTDEFLYNRFSSLDLIFTSHDKTAVGFDLSTYAGFAAGHTGFDIAVFDTANNLLGTFFLPAAPPEPTKSFFGVWSNIPIGRINAWGQFAIPQPFAIDNIEMWVPAPSSCLILGVAGFMTMRRRR